ncbi:MAG: AraC family transcriptional regulator [Candidatus Pristimantibacillus sp.]
MKLLIVDDEVIIRTGLSTVIPWNKLGYELLEPAASAEEALLRIETEQPNIILTDIQMTGRNGLDLAGEVRRLLPDSEVIILTGYDQFSYAQRAIREGVSDYMLKTSRPEEIIRGVDGAKQRIIQRWETVKRDQVRDRLLERLVSETEIDDRTLEQASKLLHKLKLTEFPNLQSIVVSASGWGNSSEQNSLLLFAVHNMMSELIDGEALLRKDNLLIVLKHDRYGGAIQQLLRELEHIERRLKCKLFAAAGSIVNDCLGLRQSYTEAVNTLSFKGITAEQRLITYDTVKDRTGGRTVCTQEEEAQLTALFQEGDPAKLNGWVEQLVAKLLADPAATPSSFQAFSHSVIISAHRWVERVLKAFGEAASSTGARLHNMTAQPTGSDNGPDRLYQPLMQLMNIYLESVGNSGIPYIKRSIAYIHDHLDKELTLQQVAKFVHLNPNHFSEVFKRETGYTYIEFVTRARIEKAKLMLDESPAKVSEVASHVGYADMKYFSQLFKRYTGFTPSEYRSRS